MTTPAPSPWRWPLYAAGSALIAIGVGGLVLGDDAKPVRVATLAIGATLAHDLLLVPLVILGSVVLRRMLPGRVRAPLQAAALVGGALLIVALPMLLHGRA